MIVEVLAIGTEVTDGDVVNTNASWLASQLNQRGYEIKFHSVVPDEEPLMHQALELAASRAKLVLVTGGLGPTVDDFTLEVAAKFFKKKLVPNPESLQRIRDFFSKLGRPMTPNQEKQALLPEASTPLPNDVGTAPGAYLVHNDVGFAFFPGVPIEMQEMFKKYFLPLLLQPEKGVYQVRKVLRCFGLPEAEFDNELRSALAGRDQLLGTTLGFRVRFPSIDIRLKSVHSNAHQAQASVDAAAHFVYEKLGNHIFGEGEDTLEEVVGRLLKERSLTIATAESCTGGLLANLITDVPGASDYFLQGVVSYSNAAKVKLLGVQKKTLDAFGAVSRETALEMAHGIKKISGADIAVSVTGIAGPTGGTKEKPTGTVHIAIIYPGGEWEKACLFPFGRARFKQITAATALDKVRRILLAS